MNKPDAPETVEPVIQALDHWEAELDPLQRARLSAARRRALTTRAEGTGTVGWLAPALAAGVLLALGIGFWPQTAAPPAPVTAPDETGLSADVGSDEALMDEDAEYLLWLASNDAA